MARTADETKLAQYADVRHLLRDGDLLLFRKSGFIASMGRGIPNHAAKIAWWGGDLFCLEVLQLAGGRAVTLSSQVQGWPARYDVYEVNPENRWGEYDRDGSTRLMRRLCGCDYGYVNLMAAALLHMPLVRCLIHAETEDKARGRRPPFCSHACAMADRIGGGVDPVPHLADRLTEPADLARSSFYRYRFTLVP